MAHMDEISYEDQQTTKTILIVEDDEDIGAFLMLAFKLETGYRCVLARDGFQAMEYVTTLIPDLLILDYQLPNMNGLQLYENLHRREPLRHVPALFMSANLFQGELERRGFSALEKPFEVEELLQRVRIIFGLRE